MAKFRNGFVNQKVQGTTTQTAQGDISRAVVTIKIPRPCLVFFLMLMLISCAPTKAYLGPELPDTELAAVWFSSNPGITARNMTIGNFEVGIFDWGARVKPGEIPFSVDLSYDLSNCDDDYRRGNSCVPFTHRYSCVGNFDAELGKSYKIQLGMGSAWVIEEGSYRMISQGRCQ